MTSNVGGGAFVASIMAPLCYGYCNKDWNMSATKRHSLFVLKILLLIYNFTFTTSVPAFIALHRPRP